MAFAYEKKRRIFLSDNGSGKLLLVCSFLYPVTSVTECDRFIINIVENCEKWAETSLFPVVLHEFEADQNPKKRFLPAARYSLECEATCDDPLSVTVCASFRPANGEKVVSRRGFVFSGEDGGLLPPEAFLDHRTLSRYRRRLSRGYCVREGKFYALGDEENDFVLMKNLINVKSEENN